SFGNSKDLSFQPPASDDLVFHFFVSHTYLVGSLAHALFQQLFGLSQSFFRTFALHELPDLAANAGEHLQEVFIGLSDLATEKFHYCQKALTEKDRKPERRMKTFDGRDRRARKVIVLGNIRGPRRFQAAPDTSRQTDSRSEGAFTTHCLELWKTGATALPDFQ